MLADCLDMHHVVALAFKLSSIGSRAFPVVDR